MFGKSREILQVKYLNQLQVYHLGKTSIGFIFSQVFFLAIWFLDIIIQKLYTGTLFNTLIFLFLFPHNALYLESCFLVHISIKIFMHNFLQTFFFLFLIHCIGFLVLCNKLPQTQQAKTTCLLSISMDQESRCGLAGSRMCMCACTQSAVSDSFCNHVNCSPPGSFVYGILQARILEWLAISSSRG